MQSFIELLATIFGTIASFGYFPQTYRIIKNKNVDNVSITTYFFFFPSIITWFIYGITIKSYPLIFTNIIATTGCLLLIISYIYIKCFVMKRLEVCEDQEK